MEERNGSTPTMSFSLCHRQPLLIPPQTRDNTRIDCFQQGMVMLLSGQSKVFWRFISWILALFLLFLVPLFRLAYVKASYGSQKHQFVYQPLIVIAGSIMSFVSFIFLCRTIWKFRFRGYPDIEMTGTQSSETKKEYSDILKGGQWLLVKLFSPLAIAYAVHKYWLYSDVTFAPLPFKLNRDADLLLIACFQSLSWAFQTIIFFYACVLFWEVCYFPLSRIKAIKDSLANAYEPDYYYVRYKPILSFLHSTSYHFRCFLAITGSVTVFCILASLYEIVNHLRTGTGILMAADLMILNIVNMTGWGLCLRSASRVAHMNCRIIQAASAMHADATFAQLSSTPFVDDRTYERHELASQSQTAWFKRATLVNFLSSNIVGISVYGFILDRFFVHTSLGAFATTTWFVLGQSLAR